MCRQDIGLDDLPFLSLQIKKDFGPESLTPFPRKKIKFLKLTPAEMEERREMLEKYIQSGGITVLCVRVSYYGLRLRMLTMVLCI